MRRSAAVALLLAAVVLAAPAARAQSPTDLWFDPAEPGWGVNVVDSGDFLFLTFFVYGPDQRPIWYTGQLQRSDDAGGFAGPVYLTQGSWFGAAWDPAAHPAPAAVGTAAFSPHGDGVHALLTYSVNGVAVTKPIQRQTLTAVPLAGGYFGVMSGGVCAGTMSTLLDSSYTLSVAEPTSGSAFLTFTLDEGTRCSVAGTLEQDGRVYRMPASSFACTGSRTFVADPTDVLIERTGRGIEGTLQQVTGNCFATTTFGAIHR